MENIKKEVDIFTSELVKINKELQKATDDKNIDKQLTEIQIITNKILDDISSYRIDLIIKKKER